MDLTFQVPMQNCYLQHRTLLLSPFTFTTGCCFCFGHIPSFFLELFLHWSPVANWALTDLGSPSFIVVSFLPFHTVHGVLKARILKWFSIPFSRGPHSVRPLHHDPSILGGPTQHGLVELDKLWSMWSNRLVVCNWSCFFTCIQISQEAGKVVWYSQLNKSFPVCCDSHSQMLWLSQ